MKRRWMGLGLLAAALAAPPVGAEENQATGDEILVAARSGAASEIAGALLRGERTQCFSCIGTVETLLYHEDQYVRQLAANWLRKRPLGFGPVMVRTRETLLDRGEDVGIRVLAAEALGNFWDFHAAAPLSTVAGTDPEASVRAAAVRALGTLNVRHGVAAVSAALADADAVVRAAALDAAIGMLPFSDHGAIVPLVTDSDASVRWRAALAVGELGIEEGADALEAVVLTDESAWVRQNAAYALGVLGADGARGTLEAASEDPDRWVRSAARVALAILR